MLTGVGFGIMNIISYIVTEHYWKKNLYASLAIITTGFETGLMAFGPLLQVLLDNIGWRNSQRVVAAMSLFGLLGVIAFTPLPANSHSGDEQPLMPEDDTRDMSEKTAMLSRNDQKETGCCGKLMDRLLEMCRFYRQMDFLIFGLAYFCYAWCYDAPFTFMPLLAENYGILATKASTLLTLFGVSGIVVRLFTLLIPGKKLSMTVLGLLVALFISGLSSLLTPLCTDYTTLAVYSFCSGSTLGEYRFL